MPSSEATAKAIEIMQTVFLWDEARCLSPEGRAVIRQAGEKLDEFAVEYELDERYTSAVARAEAAEAYAGEIEAQAVQAGVDAEAQYQRAQAAERRVAELEAALAAVRHMLPESCTPDCEVGDCALAHLVDAALAAPKEGGDGS